jgi:hypothetical protein
MMDKYEEASKIDLGEKKYLIVSNGLYFRPDCRGYTGIKDEAGRYTKEFAEGYTEATAIHEDNALEFMPTTYGDIVQKHIAKIKLERDEALEKARKFDQLVEVLSRLPEEGLMRSALCFYLSEERHQNDVVVETFEAAIMAHNLTREDTK